MQTNSHEQNTSTNEIDTFEFSRTETTYSEDSQPSSNKKIKRYADRQNVQSYRVPSTNEDDLDRMSSPVQSLPATRDEFDVYAEHIANELRQYKAPQYRLILAKLKQNINNVLSEAEFEKIKTDNQIPHFHIPSEREHSMIDIVKTEADGV